MQYVIGLNHKPGAAEHFYSSFDNNDVPAICDSLKLKKGVIPRIDFRLKW